ncbi:MAG: peptide ABC transporter substrate-binding protein [Deltaproteobacteria bacterium]|nr:peptide ABC transporter substrate-binding protein [Deltaproteobacteria bacterium]
MRTNSLGVFITVFAFTACLSTGGDAGCGRPWSASLCQCDDSSADGGVGNFAQDVVPRNGGTLRIRIAKEPSTLLSMLDSEAVIRFIIDHDILEALVRVGRYGNQVEPELATSWSLSEDRILYTFHLSPKAKWHDGHPVTSSDVQFTFSRLLDPDGQAVLREEFAEVGEVALVDEHTVTLRLDRPRPDFLFTLSMLPILPAHVFGRAPLAGHPASRAPVGSGPFRFVRWNPGQSIEIERNSEWRGEPPHLERIEYHIMSNNRIAFDLFRRGDIDIVPGLPGTTVGVEKGSRLITYPLPQFEAWIYNNSKPMFSRPATRLAVGLLIDRKAIRCSILSCRADFVEAPWPLKSAASNTLPPLSFDPARAAKLLEKDGWVDRNGDGIRERGGIDFSFSLLLPDTERELQRAAAVVQTDLARAGIKMSVVSVGPATYLSRLNARRFDASVITVPTGAMFDPWPLFHSRAIGSGENYGAFSDAESDELLDGLRNSKSPVRRLELMQKLGLRLRSKHPVTFTFRPHGAALVRDTVRGVTIRTDWFDERLLWTTGPAKKEAR